MQSLPVVRPSPPAPTGDTWDGLRVTGQDQRQIVTQSVKWGGPRRWVSEKEFRGRARGRGGRRYGERQGKRKTTGEGWREGAGVVVGIE